MELTDDLARAVIERGRKSASLLANEAFLWIVDDQTNYHLAALVAAPTGPAGADAVIYHHQQQHALTELVASLSGYAEAGEQQQAALLMSDPEEPDLQ